MKNISNKQIKEIELLFIKTSKSNNIQIDKDDIKTTLSNCDKIFLYSNKNTNILQATKEILEEIKQNIRLEQITGILVNFMITDDTDLSIVSESMDNLYETINQDINIIWGTNIVKGDELGVDLVLGM